MKNKVFEYNEILISKDKTILDALEVLGEIRSLSRQILFVIDFNNKVLGTLTDGDMRRHLTQHKDLYASLDQVCSTEFDFETEHSGYSNLTKYIKRDIAIIPVLNKAGELLTVIDTKKQRAKLPLECVLMAGGRGKRLSPLTDHTPKPMLLLGDKPIIEHNIDRLISFGIQKIYISVNYLAEKIEDYFGDGSSKGITIEYIRENEPLGTAGALSLVDQFYTEHVLLMNSDLLTNVDFESLYLKLIDEKAEMALATTEYKVDIPYAILETEAHNVKAFKEKPSYRYQSNAGIYILKNEIIKKIPKNKFCDITDVMNELLKNNEKLVYDLIIGYWIDIGKPQDYEQAKDFIKYLD